MRPVTPHSEQDSVPILRPRSEAPVRRVHRRRPPPVWVAPVVKLAVIGLLVVGGAGAVGWLSETAQLAERVAAAKQAFTDASARFGLTLQEIEVVGRRETSRSDLLLAVGLKRGDSLLTFDVDEARARIEALPWVKSAAVERAFPDAIRITLTERRPLALWQNGGRLQVIDAEGQVIRVQDLRRFRELPIVVGPDAAEHAAELLAMVGTQRDVASRLTAAIRVGGRRWNLRLDDRVDVRLPQREASAAWSKFAALQRERRILEHDIVAVDLRLPDRLVIQLAPGARERMQEAEQSTPDRRGTGSARGA